MELQKWKNRPSDPKIELALLLWWKVICIEMPGNSCWKHVRDYKAIIILLKKWLELIPDKQTKKKLVQIEDYFTEHDEIDWRLLEDVRIIAHNYLIKLGNDYNPAFEEGLSSLLIPEQWAVKRIMEITNS